MSLGACGLVPHSKSLSHGNISRCKRILTGDLLLHPWCCRLLSSVCQSSDIKSCGDAGFVTMLSETLTVTGNVDSVVSRRLFISRLDDEVARTPLPKRRRRLCQARMLSVGLGLVETFVHPLHKVKIFISRQPHGGLFLVHEEFCKP